MRPPRIGIFLRDDRLTVVALTGRDRLTHVVVEAVLKFIFGKPTTLMKSVVIEPDPLIWIVAPVLDVPGI